MCICTWYAPESTWVVFNRGFWLKGGETPPKPTPTHQQPPKSQPLVFTILNTRTNLSALCQHICHDAIAWHHVYQIWNIRLIICLMYIRTTWPIYPSLFNLKGVFFKLTHTQWSIQIRSSRGWNHYRKGGWKACKIITHVVLKTTCLY